MITLEICQKQPFDIIAMTPRGTLGLCCVHIAQLMTHLAIYTLPFTLQLCYKPLGTLQRVTKSQKVHISSHDVLQKSHTCEEGEAHLRFSFWHLLMNYEKAKNSGFWKIDKKKKIAGDHHFTYVYQKPQSDSILRYGVTQIFFVI